MSGIKVTATHSGSRPGDRAFDPLHKRDRKLMAVVGVAYGIIGAIGEAVETDHATRRVDHMARQVNARSLAAMLTAPTLDATVGVNVDAEDGITGDETEGRANRTYGVAERAPVAKAIAPIITIVKTETSIPAREATPKRNCGVVPHRFNIEAQRGFMT